MDSNEPKAPRTKLFSGGQQYLEYDKSEANQNASPNAKYESKRMTTSPEANIVPANLPLESRPPWFTAPTSRNESGTAKPPSVVQSPTVESNGSKPPLKSRRTRW